MFKVTYTKLDKLHEIHLQAHLCVHCPEKVVPYNLALITEMLITWQQTSFTAMSLKSGVKEYEKGRETVNTMKRTFNANH